MVPEAQNNGRPPDPVTPNNLRRFRHEAHISQEKLARRCDLSMYTISRIENGRIPSLMTARLIAAALGVEVDEIFPEEAA